MPKARYLQAAKGEFSEPQFPDPRKRLWTAPKKSVHLQQRLYCCDCGLAHDFEFVIVKTRRQRDGSLRMVAIAPRGYAIQWRVKRNERATAQVRRRKQVNCQ